MKNRLHVFTVMGFMLTVFLLAAVPSFAQSVDEKIKALEQELTQLKEQQIEMKREATAAAAELPSFTYRPGNGLLIEAADKSWSFRSTIESHMRINFQEGRDQRGRTQGEVMMRRFRPGFFYCINNCLYEIETAIDMDGFGTGNAKNSTATGVGSILQRGVFHFHAENLNPFLPTFTIGGDISTAAAATLSRQGSSAVGTQKEYDLLSRNPGPNTGRAGNGMTLTWDDRSLTGIGIPGRIGRFQLGMASVDEGDDNLSSFTDKKDFTAYGNIQPFSATKNKWLRGLLFEVGAWFCNIDKRDRNTATVDNGCDLIQIQDHGDAGRRNLFTTGGGSIGGGWYRWVQPGFTWEVGPYRLRAVGSWVLTPEDKGTQPGKKTADGWLIAHDIWLWSPKGFFTGSPTTVGSILFGTHFERANASCEGGAFCRSAAVNSGDFHRTRILLREWDLYYFIAPRMSIGFDVLWYDASNLRNGLNQEAHDLEVCSARRIRTGGCRNGISGDWVDISLNWRFSF